MIAEGTHIFADRVKGCWHPSGFWQDETLPRPFNAFETYPCELQSAGTATITFRYETVPPYPACMFRVGPAAIDRPIDLSRIVGSVDDRDLALALKSVVAMVDAKYAFSVSAVVRGVTLRAEQVASGKLAVVDLLVDGCTPMADKAAAFHQGDQVFRE